MNLVKFDNFSQMPEDTIGHFISYLDIDDLEQMRLVSKQFKELAESSFILDPILKSQPLWKLREFYAGGKFNIFGCIKNTKSNRWITPEKIMTIFQEMKVSKASFWVNKSSRKVLHLSDRYEVNSPVVVFEVCISDLNCNFDHSWSNHGHCYKPKFRPPSYLPKELILQILNHPNKKGEIEWNGKKIEITLKYEDLVENIQEIVDGTIISPDEEEIERKSYLGCFKQKETK